MQKVDKKKKEKRKEKSFRKEQYTALQNKLNTITTALCVHTEQDRRWVLRKHAQARAAPLARRESTGSLVTFQSFYRGRLGAEPCLTRHSRTDVFYNQQKHLQ